MRPTPVLLELTADLESGRIFGNVESSSGVGPGEWWVIRLDLCKA